MTFGSVLIAGGYQRTKLYIILTSVVILISLHLVLTPQFGIMGAAFSALSASCLACFIAGFIVWKKFGKLTNISSFTKILLSSIILFLVTYYWHLSGIYLIFTYILLSLVYFISLILIGEITKEDFNIGLRIIKSNKN